MSHPHDDHVDEYAGLPVAFAPFPEDERPRPPADAVAWRLRASEWQDDAPDHFAESLDWFFEHVETEKVRAIVVGEWEECYESDSAPIIARLVAERDRLPALRSLFLGAIAQEEAEISWIQQSDITPLLEAFPKLERLEVRGGTGLALQPVRHESLRVLRFETGGLPGHVVRAVGDCDLPALEHLELWLGVEEYGGDATIPDCAAVLSGARLPSLRHLGLQDSEMQDDIAAAVASAPVVARLEWLDLSMGVLTDVGAEALLSGQPLTHLRTLDLSHHYLSDEMMRRLPESLPGVRVILDDLQKPDGEWRYVAVSE